ncbi:MAG: FeoB-associated Cys-rich membrane protein [Candidatus Electrothrix aestuarii]|uniref:FeoB-associated Cys-rich membrane protein n=1 Tax=Candidatus Electrothrix aestuarii TaxID=3062594 RepID=A0AAU8LZU5_9BACT
MQNLIVLLVVLVAIFFVGRTLFRSYRSGLSGKCSCSGGCAGCNGDTGTACVPQNNSHPSPPGRDNRK